MLIRGYLIVIAILMNKIISLSSYRNLNIYFKYPKSILPVNTIKLYSSLNNDNNFANENIKLNLFEELKSWRKRISDESQKPIYLIFPNKVIEEIVVKRPKSLEELTLVNGLGPIKLKKYGRTILDMVIKHISDEGVDLEIEEKNKKEDTSFWDAYKKSLKPKVKKAKKVDEKTASLKRKKRIEMLSESASKELKWPDIEFIDLNEDQQKAALHILDGNNVFLTGSAGTGKTFLLRYVIQELTKKYGDEAIAITAPTGIAAVNIGGQTIHSFAGIGLATDNSDILIAKVMKSKSHVKRWNDTRVLIIDEISMLDKDIFEVLDAIAKFVHENDLPFGGIQIIVVGDFMQLPPVSKNKKLEFCFQSHIWEASALNIKNGTIHLSKIERQKDDVFIQLLNQIRLGRVSKKLMSSLDQCLITNKPLPSNGIIPTKLYSINKEVDEENAMRLQELPGNVVSMISEEKWRNKPTPSNMKSLPLFQKALDNMIPQQVDLKVGAQVMLLRNRVKTNFGAATTTGNSYGPSLVNGSRGKVIGFSESILRPGLMIPTVQFDNGVTTAIGPVEYIYRSPTGDGELVRFQVPLKLAWAATIHKSQGCTLTCAELMLENTFDYGQAYVALSRVKSLEGLWLSKPIKASAIKANPEVLAFYGYKN